MKVVTEAKRESFRRKVRNNFNPGWDLSSHTSTKQNEAKRNETKLPFCLPFTYRLHKQEKGNQNIAFSQTSFPLN